MQSGPAGHQRAGPAAPALDGDRLGDRAGQTGIGRQREVIVRAEVDKLATVDPQPDRLRSVAHHRPTPQVLPLQRKQFVVDP